MTNAQIIFLEGQKLAEAGVINYTGRTFKALNPAGEEVTIRETEDIHTFAAWKEMGYAVRKGEKAVAKFTIWKHTAKENEETGQLDSRMFMKTAAFFKASQVDKI